jgi:hypothetical protein
MSTPSERPFVPGRLRLLLRIGPKHVLLASLASLPNPAAAAVPMRCGVAVEVEGFPGLLWRRIDQRGLAEPYYTLQINNEGGARWTHLVWGILVPGAMRPRAHTTSFFRLRPEATVFSGGPEPMTMLQPWVYGPLTGPLRARHYRDGRLVGTQHLASRHEARDPRRSRLGFGWYVSDRTLLSRLAGVREWVVVVRDGAGREVGRQTLHVPAPALVEAAYRIAKPRVDAMVANYRTACSRSPL